jgi:tetratricopeptide (TPR) repeat protein
MRSFRLSGLILAAAFSASFAVAQDAPTVTGPTSPGPSAPAVPAASPQKTQAMLLDGLKRERDPEKAREIANQLLANWNDSGSATVNLLMQWANTAIGDKKNGAALDFLDRVTLLQPDYPEGWNRRATLHFTMGDARKSMADIHQVLLREPRYFPAIAGMATIFTQSGEDELALKAWERFLSVYPAEREAQENVTKLSEKLAGSRT